MKQPSTSQKEYLISGAILLFVSQTWLSSDLWPLFPHAFVFGALFAALFVLASKLFPLNDKRNKWAGTAALLVPVLFSGAQFTRSVLHIFVASFVSLLVLWIVWRPQRFSNELEKDFSLFRQLFESISGHPARLLVTTFGLLCVLGTVLLMLPAASTTRSFALVDAAFTSVSAVCVTGLIVLDTPHDFSSFGQGVILFLIQVGGLGIMTLSTAVLGLFGNRISLKHESAVAEIASATNRSSLLGALSVTLLVTVCCESIGAGLLAVLFKSDSIPWSGAIWKGVFTAISAFCNAGFALDSSSIIPHQQNAYIMHTVATLIILGGLSPVVILGILKFRKERLSLRAKIVCYTSAALLVLGFVLFLLLEWNHSLEELSIVERLHNAWFQSVTLRTAGFNSVDLSQTTAATRTIMMMLMFIGGSPGSTAGGIKTTTLFVLVMAVIGALRGRWQVNVFKRHIPNQTVFRAASITALAAFGVLCASILLYASQHMPAELIAFEVVSAMGTVGLSLGATALLGSFGKVVIMICMFIGRVGPLSALTLFHLDRKVSEWFYPEEDIDVG
ncbi:MAG: hypothetical protein IPJ88_01820 [Myxococcales bacterium]|nr:MAG: hypothetical protein IPJ88_01820 [Myxococcales bacterium]